MNYTMHDAAGRVVITGFCPDGMGPVPQDGHFMHPEGADLHLDYVASGAIVRRPANPATLTGNTITNIPPGATVSINHIDYSVDDGVVELDFTFPGTYQILVNAFPYLTASFTVVK